MSSRREAIFLPFKSSAGTESCAVQLGERIKRLKSTANRLDYLFTKRRNCANWTAVDGKATVYAAQWRASEAIRHAALAFPGESLLVIGHKHINALLMCALLNERLVRFAAHIREDTLPHLLPTDAVEALCSGRGQIPSTR